MDALQLEEKWLLDDTGIVGTHRVGDAVVVRLIGEHDFGTAPDVARALDAAVACAAASAVVADLTDCVFADAAVMSAIATASVSASARGTSLVLATSSRQVLWVLSLVGLRHSCPVAPTVAAALATP